jgi:hypothetical protein
MLRVYAFPDRAGVESARGLTPALRWVPPYGARDRCRRRTPDLSPGLAYAAAARLFFSPELDPFLSCTFSPEPDR